MHWSLARNCLDLSNVRSWLQLEQGCLGENPKKPDEIAYSIQGISSGISAKIFAGSATLILET